LICRSAGKIRAAHHYAITACPPKFGWIHRRRLLRLEPKTRHAASLPCGSGPAAQFIRRTSNAAKVRASRTSLSHPVPEIGDHYDTSERFDFLRVAPKFGFTPSDVANYNNFFRNVVFSYLSPERLMMIYAKQGLDEVIEEVGELRRLHVI
jgi:hypothetical protein